MTRDTYCREMVYYYIRHEHARGFGRATGLGSFI
jgi:hypothetical protein